MAKASKAINANTAAINADLENAISDIRVAKAFTNENYEIEKFEHRNSHFRETKTAHFACPTLLEKSSHFNIG